MRRAISGSLSIFVLLVVIAYFSFGGTGAIKRFMYSGFDRDEWQYPDEVVSALALSPGAHVADVGAGGGYFTFRLARAVGAEGRVYAVDIDPDMLEHITEGAGEQGLPQIVTVMGATADPGLPDDSVDLIFISNTFHHLPQRAAYFRGARRALRPGGRIAVIEVKENSFPSDHFTLPETIVSEMAEAGYRVVERHEFLPRQSFQIFAVTEGASSDPIDGE